jgi:hypothetical protein
MHASSAGPQTLGLGLLAGVSDESLHEGHCGRSCPHKRSRLPATPYTHQPHDVAPGHLGPVSEPEQVSGCQLNHYADSTSCGVEPGAASHRNGGASGLPALPLSRLDGFHPGLSHYISCGTQVRLPSANLMRQDLLAMISLYCSMRGRSAFCPPPRSPVNRHNIRQIFTFNIWVQ